MALVTFFFLIASLRTNVVFVLVFLFIDLAFILLMATYWTLAEGRTAVAGKCQIVSTRIPASPSSNWNFDQHINTGSRCFHLHLLCLRLVFILGNAFIGRGFPICLTNG